MVKWDSGGLPQSPQLMGDTGTRLKINLEKFMRLNLNKRFVSQNTRNGESSDSATCEIVISSMEFGIGSKWFTNVRLSYVTEYRCQTSTSPSSYHPDVSLPRESKIGERGPTWNSSPLTEQLPVYSGSERERESTEVRSEKVWLGAHCWSCPRTFSPRGSPVSFGGEWEEGWTGSSPSQPLFLWNHRESFVTVGARFGPIPPHNGCLYLSVASRNTRHSV